MQQQRRDHPGRTCHLAVRRQSHPSRLPALFLALGGDANAVLHERALRVGGVWIDGGLDFEGCKVLAWLELVSCTIGGTLVLTDAEIRGLNLRGTQVSKIEAERLHSEGIVALNKTTRVNGIINLKGARIDGDLNCFGCNINGGGGLAFNAFGAEIKGNVFLNNKFKAKGQVDLSGTNIAGHVICDDGCFEGHSVKTMAKKRANGP